MTNLSPELPAWQRRFTRERVLVGSPLLGVLVVILVLVGVDGWPRFGRLQQQQQRLEELRQKQGALPGLQRQLVNAQIRAREEEEQQALLVDLIAGRERIQTFLAQLSREASSTGVVIELYEPEASALPPDAGPPGSPNRSSGSQAEEQGKDPLINLGYSKTSVLFQAKGSYAALQAFLRRMENLQLLVQPSDLALQALDDQANAQEPGVVVRPLTQLKLRLSFFDKTAGEANPSASGAGRSEAWRS